MLTPRFVLAVVGPAKKPHYSENCTNQVSTRVNRVLAVVLPNSIIKTTMCSINICSDVYLEKHSLLEYACELSMPTLYTIQISHLNDLHRNCRKSWGPR